VDEPESRPPLADDLSFLADLDQGLDVEKPRGSLTPRRRPLLDLFPPRPAGARAGSHGSARPPLPGRPPGAAFWLPQSGASPASRTYEAFYGLNEAPFSLIPDPKFLYHSSSHDRAAQEILSAIVRRDPIIMLTGDAGSGKTTLCQAVTEQIDRRTFTAFVADPILDVEDLLKSLLIGFGVISRADLTGGRLSGAKESELTIALKEFLLSLVPLNGFAVVFIDEAQNLSPEMLEGVRAVADIDSDRCLIQFVIIGEPGLLKTLRQQELSRFDQGVSVRCELLPLTQDEVGDYVSHRLAVAGDGQSHVEFDDGVFALMYEWTHGLPGRLNRLCDRVLALGYEQSSSLIDAAVVETAASDVGFIAPDAPSAKLVRLGLGAVMFVVLTLMGAGAGTFVFRTQIRRAVAEWQALPPSPPPPALIVVAPIEPVAEPAGPRLKPPGP
jgi:general secretion pathway protein A